jgi:hypothetical protein
MSYYAQRTLLVLSPDPHGVHETRKAVVLSDVNHPDIGPNQDPQRYAVICCTTTDEYSHAPVRLPTRGLETGMFRRPVYAMPWSLHTVEDPADENGVEIADAQGKVTEEAFTRIRDGLYEYLGGEVNN